jgi:hypothetical protein
MADSQVLVRGKHVPLPDISAQFKSTAGAIEQAIKVLDAHLNRFSNWKSVRVSPRFEELRRDLPYVIHGVDAKGRYIIVNRDYKPLGVPSDDWEDYEKYPHVHIALTDAQIKEVVHRDHTRGIFGDGSTPWQTRQKAINYILRLEKLLKTIRG